MILTHSFRELGEPKNLRHLGPWVDETHAKDFQDGVKKLNERSLDYHILNAKFTEKTYLDVGYEVRIVGDKYEVIK